MNDTHIDYDQKVQDALKSVVRSVLTDAEKNGLPGEHHFYIAFRTQADEVNIPNHLKARFPDEMTIVLQHKFWGLKVEQDYFQVGLSFNQRPELLTIPFAAVTGFVDPSVQFALQFQDSLPLEEDLPLDEDDIVGGVPVTRDQSDHANTPDAPKQDADPKFSRKHTAPHTELPNPSDDTAQNANGANIVTLDAFRKK